MWTCCRGWNIGRRQAVAGRNGESVGGPFFELNTMAPKERKRCCGRPRRAGECLRQLDELDEAPWWWQLYAQDEATGRATEKQRGLSTSSTTDTRHEKDHSYRRLLPAVFAHQLRAITKKRRGLFDEHQRDPPAVARPHARAHGGLCRARGGLHIVAANRRTSLANGVDRLAGGLANAGSRRGLGAADNPRLVAALVHPNPTYCWARRCRS